MYSGAVAGAVYARLDMPSCLHPALPEPHRLRTAPLDHDPRRVETPLGTLPIDSELASALLAEFPLLTDDADAHRAEHAIEVQLPFLRRDALTSASSDCHWHRTI